MSLQRAACDDLCSNIKFIHYISFIEVKNRNPQKKSVLVCPGFEPMQTGILYTLHSNIKFIHYISFIEVKNKNTQKKSALFRLGFEPAQSRPGDRLQGEKTLCQARASSPHSLALKASTLTIHLHWVTPSE